MPFTVEDVHVMCMFHIFFRHKCLLEQEVKEYCTRVLGSGSGAAALRPLEHAHGKVVSLVHSRHNGSCTCCANEQAMAM